MTESQSPAYSGRHLYELVQNKKFKDCKAYLIGIENQDEQAQKAVKGLFRQLFIKKKCKEPPILLNAMVLYKHLLLGGVMDYICIQDVFPQAVHQEVLKMCQFKGNEKDIQARANAYFKQVMGAPITQDTVNQRRNFIQLALELIKSMAKWYPTEYDDSTAESYFKEQYQKLVRKGVYFPEENNFLIIKASDAEIFKRNYQRFMSYQNNQSEQCSPLKEQKVESKKIDPPPLIQIKEVQRDEKKAEESITNMPAQSKIVVKIDDSIQNSKSTSNQLLNIKNKNLVSKVHPQSQQTSKDEVKQKQLAKSRQTDMQRSKDKSMTLSPRNDDLFTSFELEDMQKSVKKGEQKPSEKKNIDVITEKSEENFDQFDKETFMKSSIKRISGRQSEKLKNNVENGTNNAEAHKNVTSDSLNSKNKGNIVDKKGNTAEAQPHSSGIDKKANNNFGNTLNIESQKNQKQSMKNTGTFQEGQKGKRQASRIQKTDIKIDLKKDDLKHQQKIDENMQHHHYQPKKQSAAEPKASQKSIRKSEKAINIKIEQVPTFKEEPQPVIIVRQENKIDSNQPLNSLISHQIDSYSNTFSFAHSKFQSPKRAQTPKRIFKNQKPNSHQKSLQISPIRAEDIQNRVIEQQSSPIQKRVQKPKSLPKTEKKRNFDFSVDYAQISNKKVSEIEQNTFSFNPPPKHHQQMKQQQYQELSFNKTLSYFATARKRKGNNLQDIQKYHTAGQTLDRMRLNRYQIPFHPHYFEPVTLAMNSLRGQSLNLFNSGSGYGHFYFGRHFQARLLKEEDQQYIISLHNISKEPLTINYHDMKNNVYGKNITILSWGNKQQIYPYVINKNGYFQIKFHFKSHDLNFKFLNFQLIVNNKLWDFVLPITLLDMCSISQTSTSHLQQYALRGSIVSSDPFRLRQSGLPQFLGGFMFGRSGRNVQSVVGQGKVEVNRKQGNSLSTSDLHILVRCCDRNGQKVKVEIVYLTKDQWAMDLAKVLLYLLTFLLQG